MKHPTHIVACGALVRDGEGRVLLIKSPKHGWEFPGGQLEVGESLTEGVLREVEEETGVTARVERLAAVVSNVGTYPDWDGDMVPTKVMLDFICTYISGDLRTSEESLAVEWFTEDQALSMVEHPALKQRLEDMLANAPGVVYRACVTRPQYEVHEEIVI